MESELSSVAIRADLLMQWSENMEPIERLEKAIESAESIHSKPLTVTILLTEVYRQALRGFTDSEATVFAERLEVLIAACN